VSGVDGVVLQVWMSWEKLLRNWSFRWQKARVRKVCL